jgi:hypothetical protein
MIDLVGNSCGNFSWAMTQNQRRHIVDEIRSPVAIGICKNRPRSIRDVERKWVPVDGVPSISTWHDFHGSIV